MTVDPSFAVSGVSGTEWQIQPVEDTAAAGDAGSGFGAMLSDSIQALSKTQTDAAGASQALASGTATDPTAVVMSVERAQLAMQMAGQIRTKAVEAAQEIFRTQM